MTAEPVLTLRKPCKVRDVATAPLATTFSRARLVVVDDIWGGPRRGVAVEIGRAESGTVLLKTVERLAKTEFENIFGFAPGEFEKGRTVAVNSEDVVRADNLLHY